jgi:prepilin-type N-terminal cleavage/methylation domain-containing protein
MPHRKTVTKSGRHGFSLMEFMIVMAILATVIGVATDGLMMLQKRSRADSARIDMTQEARQFMDQVTNDIHQIGYPGARLFDPAGGQPANNISSGLISVSSGAMQFEADVDGSGTVSEVYIQVVVPNAGCPCILQRGTIAKSQVGSGAIPYYTEVNNVMNTTIFDAYDFAGNLISLPASATDLPNIRTIRMTVNVQQNVADMDRSKPTVTMVSEAKINN